MNWLIDTLRKEARRFQPGHAARYYSHPQRGKGKGVVHQPSFRRGTVVRYDSNLRRYILTEDGSDEEIQVHPRNMVPDSISVPQTPDVQPLTSPESLNENLLQ